MPLYHTKASTEPPPTTVDPIAGVFASLTLATFPVVGVGRFATVFATEIFRTASMVVSPF